eukprot:5268354-Prymnesium_polylepis.1
MLGAPALVALPAPPSLRLMMMRSCGCCGHGYGCRGCCCGHGHHSDRSLHCDTSGTEPWATAGARATCLITGILVEDMVKNQRRSYEIVWIVLDRADRAGSWHDLGVLGVLICTDGVKKPSREGLPAFGVWEISASGIGPVRHLEPRPPARIST